MDAVPETARRWGRSAGGEEHPRAGPQRRAAGGRGPALGRDAAVQPDQGAGGERAAGDQFTLNLATQLQTSAAWVFLLGKRRGGKEGDFARTVGDPRSSASGGIKSQPVSTRSTRLTSTAV